MELIARAVVMFVATNVDDLVLLTLFLGTAGADPGAVRRVVAGQFLGFGAILGLSVGGAAGAGLLPGDAVPYLGLVPLVLGVRAAIALWRHGSEGDEDEAAGRRLGTGVWTVAGITLANGADNVGVYVPAFAVASAAGVAAYCGIFLVGVGALCATARVLATRPVVARAIERWGHLALPVVLVALGVVILVEGGAFGL